MPSSLTKATSSCTHTATLPGQEINLAKAAGTRAAGGLGLPLPLRSRFPDVSYHHHMDVLNKVVVLE
jgi:hypothetical protein